MIGKNIPLGMAIGIEAESGSVIDSLNSLAKDTQKFATQLLQPPDLPSLSNQALSHEIAHQSSNGQPIYIEMDGRIVAKGIMPHAVNEIRQKTGIKFN